MGGWGIGEEVGGEGGVQVGAQGFCRIQTSSDARRGTGDTRMGGWLPPEGSACQQGRPCRQCAPEATVRVPASKELQRI